MSRGTTPDFGSLRREIRGYLDAFVDAHANNRPKFSIQGVADDYVNVSCGELLR